MGKMEMGVGVGCGDPAKCKRFNDSQIKPRPAPKIFAYSARVCVMIDGNMLTKGLRALFGLSGA